MLPIEGQRLRLVLSPPTPPYPPVFFHDSFTLSRRFPGTLLSHKVHLMLMLNQLPFYEGNCGPGAQHLSARGLAPLRLILGIGLLPPPLFLCADQLCRRERDPLPLPHAVLLSPSHLPHLALLLSLQCRTGM